MSDSETGGAIFDPNGGYRYLLWRLWDDSLPSLGFILLNPSIADGERDDPTLNRCGGFARSWGFGRVSVANLFAWRSTDSRALRSAVDPIGEGNDRYIKQLVSEADTVVAAWGTAAEKHAFASENSQSRPQTGFLESVAGR